MQTFDIGVTINNEDMIIASVSISAVQKVLTGFNGYLFLDQDSNHSKEQYVGQRIISKHDLSLWNRYFKTTKTYMYRNDIEYVFCLAPAKENVLSTYYPFKKSPKTSVEQLLEINDNIINPVEFLREIGDCSYSKTDTHWSDFAALQVAEYVYKKFKKTSIDFPQLRCPFYVQLSYGDLGVKTTPPKSEKILKADFSIINQKLIFDNEVKNRGWVRVFQNNDSISNEVVVFFGDSYSINMLLYYVNKYRRVVHVFSGASIDCNIIEHEKPTKIIIEIASRFIIMPPRENFCFTSEISRKYKKIFSDNSNSLHESSLSFYFNKVNDLKSSMH